MIKEWKIFKLNNIDYNVSNYGDIINITTGRTIKNRLNKYCYPVVTLGESSNRKIYSVHRIVAELFIPNPDNLPEVNHKDYNRENYSCLNLEWMTHADNVKYSASVGRHVSLKGKDNPNYGNKKLSIKYKSNPLLSKEKQSRPAEQNGRAKKIKLYDKNMIYINTFSYIGACAQYLIEQDCTTATLNSVRCNISKALKNNETYLNHNYKNI